MTYLVSKGHTLEYAKSLPIALLKALEILIDAKLLGPENERRREAQMERRHNEIINLNGALHGKNWQPKELPSINVISPPPGWDKDHVERFKEEEELRKYIDPGIEMYEG